MNPWVEELEKRLKREVAPLSGVTVALSGGIDSSLLAALIKPKLAVTVDVPGGARYNEVKRASAIAKHLGLKHLIIRPDPKQFKELMPTAVRAIGRPIPHFNIYPLFWMYRELAGLGVKDLVLGDGPDESMSGYTRNLIMNYLYGAYERESLKYYHPTLDKILHSREYAYSILSGHSMPEVEKLMKDQSLIRGMNRVEMTLSRRLMDDMSDGLALYFQIKNYRPYQDRNSFDRWQYSLPDHCKIDPTGEYGKYALRLVAEKYLPKEVVWDKHKIGGPVWPVNKMFKGWMKAGEFNKDNFLNYQAKILEI